MVRASLFSRATTTLSGQSKRKSEEHSDGGVALEDAVQTQESNTVPTRSPKQSDVSREKELELLTSYASDSVYRLRYDTMTYDYISPAVTRLLGFSVEEMKNLKFRALILETRLITNGVKVIESFEELEEKRKAGDVNKWQADYKLRTKDGRQIWVMDVSYPWFDEQGNVIGSIGSLRDITDRMEIEAKMREEVQRLSNVDALTGLANRRQFFQELEKELKRIKRTLSDVSILLIDIDHFRETNERYGDDVGDAVIVEMGKLIQTAIRETDMIARLGGEEFAVLLPETPSEGAFWVGERIRAAVLSHCFSVGTDHTPVTCTVSVGVAAASMADDVTSSDMYKAADTRLYIAKHTGANQVAADEMRKTH